MSRFGVPFAPMTARELPSLSTLVASLMKGSPRALAQLISRVEDDPEVGLQVVASLPERPIKGHVLGITGPPGAGKSTLVDRLVKEEREKGHSVAVLLVDPSSPFTGGAVLGDRIRMQHHTADPGVFIRSLSNRGHGGGLSAGTPEVVALCLAAGYSRILLETVGVGQTELEVMELADTVAVVAVPGAGDSIQAMKAGLLEIGHLFIVNKADRPGADRLVAELLEMIHEGVPAARVVWGGWEVPVIPVSAAEGTGIDALHRALETHRSLRRTHPPSPATPGNQMEALLTRVLESRMHHGIQRAFRSGGRWEQPAKRGEEGTANLYTLTMEMLADEETLATLLTGKKPR